MKTLYHGGDLGDTIYQVLPYAMSTYAEYNLALYRANFAVRERYTKEKVDKVREFFELQPLIRSVTHTDRAIPTRDLDGYSNYVVLDKWRRQHHPHSNTLLDNCLRTFRLNKWDHARSWLTVDQLNKAAPVVINRTARYHAKERFPWKEVVERYGKEAVFVGSVDEHKQFCGSFGHIPFYHTPTLLKLARVIAGAALFIGNQSTPLALAHGLGRPVYVEEDRHCPNCHFTRKRANYGAKAWKEVAAYDLSQIVPCEPLADWQLGTQPKCKQPRPDFPQLTTDELHYAVKERERLYQAELERFGTKSKAITPLTAEQIYNATHLTSLTFNDNVPLPSSTSEAEQTGDDNGQGTTGSNHHEERTTSEGSNELRSSDVGSEGTRERREHHEG